MKVAALIYCDSRITETDLFFNSEYLPDFLAGAISGIECVGKIFFAAHESFSGKAFTAGETIRYVEPGDIPLFRKILEDDSVDHVAKIYADAPFLDRALVAEMCEVHLRYLPEFTYSENLPQGFTCEIASRELVESLKDTENASMPLGELVRANIHHFDVEIFYKEPDIRDKRITFRTASARDRRIMERIVGSHGKIPAYAELRDIIHRDPSVLYAGPSFVEVELTGRCGLDCIYCYRKTLKSVHADMEVSLYRKLLEQMRGFALPYSVCLGGSGEPLMHPKFYEIAEASLAEPLLKNLVIETNGVLADANFRSFYSSMNDQRVRVIVNLSAIDAASYRALHGADFFDTVRSNVLSLRETIADRAGLYLQIMKINETEPFIDRYYDFWEKHEVPIILQKQNVYLGRVEDRRYSDLSPIDRIPCWHLQRDLFILSDGTVGFCKQDVEGALSRYSLATGSLAEIFEARCENFIRDYKGTLAGSPDCASCDEWYTFNL